MLCGVNGFAQKKASIQFESVSHDFGTFTDKTPKQEYTFVFTNVGVDNRWIAENYQYKFGAYATSHMNNTAYNFYLDLFVFGGEAIQTVENPVIDLASGVYFNDIDVTITCPTPGATIR